MAFYGISVRTLSGLCTSCVCHDWCFPFFSNLSWWDAFIRIFPVLLLLATHFDCLPPFALGVWGSFSLVSLRWPHLLPSYGLYDYTSLHNSRMIFTHMSTKCKIFKIVEDLFPSHFLHFAVYPLRTVGALSWPSGCSPIPFIAHQI